jgi:hypothetical protein
MGVLGDIIQHQTEHLTLLPTFYLGVGRVYSLKRVRGVTADNPWNAHLWDVD